MAMDKAVKKAFIRYTKKKYPDESEQIIKRADALFPELYAKAPDIGGSENLMAYNLDMFIVAISFYEASGHRIDGYAIGEIAQDIYERFRFLRYFINLNRKRTMKLFRNLLYKKYVPYAHLVKEKRSKGQWGNTWQICINPDDDCEGVRFDLIGCPLADYASANGYSDLLPYLCATDHVIPKLIHAKLIRTHTCALGSDSCDYWYVGDESETARNYKGKLV